MSEAAPTPGISGINHVTLAVSKLECSIAFYRDVIGCNLRALWANGAYLEAGDLWICLSVDNAVANRRTPDYTHLAFSAHESDFDVIASRITGSTQLWKDNHSEGASVYFVDPDGHKLELHCGSLQSRLEHYRSHPSMGVSVMDDDVADNV